VYRDRLPFFVTITVSLGLALAEFILEYFVPKKQSVYDALGVEDECPYEYADIFSVLSFSWMTPMMKHGYKNYLTQDDMWNLREQDASRVTSGRLTKAWEYELQKKKPSLWIALFRAFGGVLRSWSHHQVGKRHSRFRSTPAPPTANQLHQISRRRGPSARYSWRLHRSGHVCRFLCVKLLAPSILSGRVRNRPEGQIVLTSMIYSKSLRLSNEGRLTKTTGDIVNPHGRRPTASLRSGSVWRPALVCSVSDHFMFGLPIPAPRCQHACWYRGHDSNESH